MSHRPWNYGITGFWIGITSHVTWREAMVVMVQYFQGCVVPSSSSIWAANCGLQRDRQEWEQTWLPTRIKRHHIFWRQWPSSPRTISMFFAWSVKSVVNSLRSFFALSGHRTQAGKRGAGWIAHVGRKWSRSPWLAGSRPRCSVGKAALRLVSMPDIVAIPIVPHPEYIMCTSQQVVSRKFPFQDKCCLFGFVSRRQIVNQGHQAFD